ncbi:MAG: hypothetical protein Q4D29_03430 [Lachnospiraceae bacterium]|nr:hypothetical protein [Lachnospiraceae bacterium]
MKRTLIKIAVFIAVFFVGLKGFGDVLNRGNTDFTQDTPKATLPVIYMNINGNYMNALHGYVCEMEGSYLRDNITPINADRTLDIRIDTYGFAVAKVAYELRSLDGQRLIEDTELDSFEFNNNTINSKLSFKDLMNEDKEYMLVIKLITGEGNAVRYYTRIINTEDLFMSDKLDFILDFSNKAFKEETAVELKKYMETNREGDNSSYGHVNIHSNFNQLHYGNLQPMLTSEKNINLISIDSVNACVELLFRVHAKNNDYNVREYFRVRRGSDRMYLMEYDRTMDQIINESSDVIVKGKILNGIVNEKIKYKESKSAGIVDFVQQNALYSFNTSGGTLTRIFSFIDDKNDDARTRYDAHDIKILSIDENGNTYFIVYGYMNRGLHEGTTGITLYYYDAVVNTIEEQVYIPYTKNYEMLALDVEKLSYMNVRNQMYIFVDGAVYNIDIEAKTVATLSDNLDESRFVSSSDNSMIAWQTGDSIIEYNSIQLYNLNSRSPVIVEAGPNSIVIPLGFIAQDLVYGTAHTGDITTDSAGRTIIPMNKVIIQNINGEKLLEYTRENIYITDVDITDEMIVLHRTSRTEGGDYYEIDNDEILNNSTEEATKNVYKSVITEEMETTYQIVLAKEGNYDSVKVLNPKEVLYEENRTADLEYKDTTNRYYVYAAGNLEGIYNDPAEAVIKAEELFGEVVNKGDSYVWESGHRKSKFRIETIGDTFISDIVTEENSSNETDENQGSTPLETFESVNRAGSMTICLEQMLKYNEIYKDADTLLAGNNTVMSVLRDNIDGDVLNLTGCTLDSVLYYVGRGMPVLAMTERGNAVLIVGFDSKNTVIYNPLDTEIRKMGINDSRAYFEGFGNKFVSYIK